MRTLTLARSAQGVAALLLVTGCATQPAPREEVALPADSRVVVDLSPETVDALAARIAERLQPAARAPIAVAPLAVRPVAVRPVAQPTRPARAPRVEIPLPSLPSVHGDTMKKESSVAVDRALAWLASHQSDDGSFRGDAFHANCGGDPCDGAGSAHYAPGLTGLAVLAFLGDGHTPRSGAHADVVKNAIRYLKTIQDPEGCLGPRVSQHFQYNHMLGSLALCEAFALTKSPVLRGPAQKAVDFVLMSQNPYLGWRYGVRDGDNDTSMTGWAVIVLVSARNAGLAVDDSAFSGARAWIDKMTEPEFGRIGYNRRGGPAARMMETMDRFPSEHSEAPTASGTLARVLTGDDAKTSEMVQKAVDLMSRRPPIWDVERGTNDFYYWYLGTQAMQRAGDRKWDAWARRLYTAVVPNQVQDADDHAFGSWDPIDPWGNEGGRIYSTAILALSLQTLTR